MENLDRAFSLMGIGMITVFLVLTLVVLAGNLLIRLINAFASESGNQNSKGPTDPKQIPPKHIAAITSAVYHVLGGQGKIEKIEKL